MKTFAEAETRLAESLPGYESRPQQQTLARAVEVALAQPLNDTPHHLIAQAGCGTGKSLGYAIPAILSGKRVVVSVTTKALQDQLTGKDIPFLEAHLGVPFRWALLKGRSNYFCTAKATAADDVPRLAEMLRATSDPDFDGQRESFPFEIDTRDWMSVAADSEDCSALGCKTGDGCYAERARRRAREADIVVVNHALFFTDLMVKEFTNGVGMLDEYDVVIFDEAHEVEEIAAERLGASFTEGTIRSLAGQVRTWAQRYADDPAPEAIEAATTRLLAATSRLWEALPVGRLRAATIADSEAEFGEMLDALAAYAQAFYDAKMENTGDYERGKKRQGILARRINSTLDRFHAIITASFEEVVRWVAEERNRDGSTKKVLKTAPISVSDPLREMLFSQTPAVLVSATLAVNGKMDYIAGRLGIDTFDSLDVGTPFDFAKQAMTYVPTHLPEPTGQQVRNWETQCAEEIVDLVKASRGRALVLFTSVKHMRETYNSIKGRIPYTVMMQGEAAPRVLAERFKSETDSVLFGTKSFFTGVDFSGETCSLVVITKMPFPVPSEPVIEARCDAIQKRGGNPFGDYTIPVMSLVLQQAYGRLIRHREDRGVVAILDPRLKTKGYGRSILRDLPPAPLATDFASVESFFSAA